MSSAKTNVQLLAGSQAFNQRAKKARREQVDSIKFDDEARREWLTGFSKRKKAKTEERRARAKEREHAEHLEERKKARKELKERALQNMKSVRAAMGLSETVDDEPEAGPSSPREEMAEYSDEDQLATVTITEDFDPSASTLPPPSRRREDAGEQKETKTAPSAPLMPASSARAQGKAKREADKLKAKKSLEKERSRSMETKSERRKGKEMEARRRSKKAGIAMEKYGSSGERKKKAGVKLKKKFR